VLTRLDRLQMAVVERGPRREVFVLYGLTFIVFPEFLSQFVTGAVPASASGMIDMRATYGGMSIAIGALLFILAANQERVGVGLLGVLLIMLGLGGRS
jgi:hypothetical protein